ncbi:MAG: lectin-like protein [Planctomycetota bacterium]|nr:lectin-like protein [Planctomycetota bacterium]
MNRSRINLHTLIPCMLAALGLGGIAQADIAYDYIGSYGGHDYYVTDLELEYYDARQAAEQLGIDLGAQSYLASVTSQAETDWIQSHSLNTMWIGLNDLDLDGNWSWDSGEVFDWTDWAPGEPNGNWEDENVAVMNWGVDVDGSTVYGWNDWKDQNRFAQALIEVVVPAPGVLAVLGLAGLRTRRRRH